jgi:hypothetical protein
MIKAHVLAQGRITGSAAEKHCFCSAAAWKHTGFD